MLVKLKPNQIGLSSANYTSKMPNAPVAPCPCLGLAEKKDNNAYFSQSEVFPIFCTCSNSVSLSPLELCFSLRYGKFPTIWLCCHHLIMATTISHCLAPICELSNYNEESISSEGILESVECHHGMHPDRSPEDT